MLLSMASCQTENSTSENTENQLDSTETSSLVLDGEIHF